ncbi:MAG: hypothetical protein IPG34_16530 [Rhodocyclaceae bacterium]|nr:hypothetical protein [Rhodocyclaceae bacterium]
MAHIKRRSMMRMRAALNNLMRAAGCRDLAERVFANEPTLHDITLRYLYYLSPWLVANECNLAQETVALALQRYTERNVNADHEAAFRAFIETLTESAVVLADVRISVKSAEGQWMIWSYDEPLTLWMEEHKHSCIQIRDASSDVPVALL